MTVAAAPATTVLTPKQAFERYRDELCLFRDDGRPAVLPGVIGTIIFERGSKPEVRAGLLACFDRFKKMFGAHLRGGRRADGGVFTECTSKNAAAMRRTITARKPWDKIIVVRSSATDKDMAAAYQIEARASSESKEGYTFPGTGLVVSKGDDRGELSYLKFQLPLEHVAAAGGLADYLAFLRFACQQLPVRGGYGGLSPVLPYDPGRYASTEWALAARFSGMEIDSWMFWEPRSYKTTSYDGPSEEEAIAYFPYLKPGAKTGAWGFSKGVNWVTLLGEPFIGRLGGEALIREALDRPDIGVERICGSLLIQAGPFPRLGAPEEGLPEPYVFVNRVLRVLRHPEPDLHADRDIAKAWAGRFDLPGSPPIPTPPTAVPNPDDEWMKQTYWPRNTGGRVSADSGFIAEAEEVRHRLSKLLNDNAEFRYPAAATPLSWGECPADFRYHRMGDKRFLVLPPAETTWSSLFPEVFPLVKLKPNKKFAGAFPDCLEKLMGRHGHRIFELVMSFGTLLVDGGGMHFHFGPLCRRYSADNHCEVVWLSGFDPFYRRYPAISAWNGGDLVRFHAPGLRGHWGSYLKQGFIGTGQLEDVLQHNKSVGDPLPCEDDPETFAILARLGWTEEVLAQTHWRMFTTDFD